MMERDFYENYFRKCPTTWWNLLKMFKADRRRIFFLHTLHFFFFNWKILFRKVAFALWSLFARTWSYFDLKLINASVNGTAKLWIFNLLNLITKSDGDRNYVTSKDVKGFFENPPKRKRIGFSHGSKWVVERAGLYRDSLAICASQRRRRTYKISSIFDFRDRRTRGATCVYSIARVRLGVIYRGELSEC